MEEMYSHFSARRLGVNLVCNLVTFAICKYSPHPKSPKPRHLSIFVSQSVELIVREMPHILCSLVLSTLSWLYTTPDPRPLHHRAHLYGSGHM